MILNRAKNYYNKKRLREQARHKYRNLFEEYKNKKKEYGRNRYRDMPEEKKQILKEYQKSYRASKKLKQKVFDCFSFHCINDGTKSSVFRRKRHHNLFRWYL